MSRLRYAPPCVTLAMLPPAMRYRPLLMPYDFHEIFTGWLRHTRHAERTPHVARIVTIRHNVCRYARCMMPITLPLLRAVTPPLSRCRAT